MFTQSLTGVGDALISRQINTGADGMLILPTPVVNFVSVKAKYILNLCTVA